MSKDDPKQDEPEGFAEWFDDVGPDAAVYPEQHKVARRWALAAARRFGAVEGEPSTEEIERSLYEVWKERGLPVDGVYVTEDYRLGYLAGARRGK